MSEPLYVLYLEETAAAAFPAPGKPYIGSETELLTLAAEFEAGSEYPDTVRGIRRYFAGDRGVVHRIGGHEIPVLAPTTVLERGECRLAETELPYRNFMDETLTMRFQEAHIQQLLATLEERTCRFVRAAFTNLTYTDANGDQKPVDLYLVGYGGLLAYDQGSDGVIQVRNKLFVLEEVASDSVEVSLGNPDNLTFRCIFDDIFMED